MSASLVGSEMCIRDRERSLQAPTLHSSVPSHPLRPRFGEDHRRAAHRLPLQDRGSLSEDGMEQA
eukprot:2173779-Alexandrium_andersonii.AAC.1